MRDDTFEALVFLYRGIGRLPTRAPQVFAWWAHDAVRDAFPTLARFVLEVIVLLPSSAKNGCGV